MWRRKTRLKADSGEKERLRRKWSCRQVDRRKDAQTDRQRANMAVCQLGNRSAQNMYQFSKAIHSQLLHTRSHYTNDHPTLATLHTPSWKHILNQIVNAAAVPKITVTANEGKVTAGKRSIDRRRSTTKACNQKNSILTPYLLVRKHSFGYLIAHSSFPVSDLSIESRSSST